MPKKSFFFATTFNQKLDMLTYHFLNRNSETTVTIFRIFFIKLQKFKEHFKSFLY